MDVEKEMEFQSQEVFSQLSLVLKNTKTSLDSIKTTCQWLMNIFNGFGSAYATLHSDIGLGVEWITWVPETLFNEKIREVDFSEMILKYQNMRESAIIPASDVKTLNQLSLHWVERNQIRDALALPFFYNQDVNGLFLIYRQDQQPEFTIEEVQLASIISKLISRVLELQILLENTEQKIIEQDQMLRASLSMTDSLNLEEVLTAILKNALQLLPEANDAHIFLYENERLKFGAAMFQNGTVGHVWAEPREDGLTYNVARKGKMILVDNMKADPLYINSPQEWHGSIIGIPLIDKDIVVGVMTLAKLTTKKFSPKEITILNRLADQAARVIQNVNIHSLISLQAYTDPLTAIPNRRAFEWEASKLLEMSTRYEHSFSVAMLDLNGFKRINDSYGHATGDDCLRILTHCMKNAIRKTDFLARFGGDEFIILFPETANDLANQVAKKLQKRVAQCQIPIAPNKIETLTVSYGLATFPDDSNLISKLIELADNRLYASKNKSK